VTDPLVFLSVQQVLDIHQRIIDVFGGDHAVRDPGLLESAVTMPGARFNGKYLHHGIPSMAAAYLFHVCKNHAFLDGNKRTALTAAEVFVLLNNRRLNATDLELEVLTMGVAAGDISKDEVTKFFKKHVV